MPVEFTIEPTKITTKYDLAYRRAEILMCNYDGTYGIFRTLGNAYEMEIVFVSPFVTVMPRKVVIEGTNSVALRGNRISRRLMTYFEDRLGKSGVPKRSIFSKTEASILTGVSTRDILHLRWPPKRKNRYRLTVDPVKYFGRVFADAVRP